MPRKETLTQLRRTARLMGGAATLLVALSLGAPAFAQGTLNVAISDEPPHLDTQMTTATLTTLVNLNIMETLYAFNADNEAVPLLVASETISDDGLTAVLTLRDDVMFHNGEPMMADDVVASLVPLGRAWRSRQALLRQGRERRGHRRA